MRGKVVQLFDLLLRVRITPAYAGKRHYYDVSYVGGEDHPRLCGEKVSGMRRSCKNSGSPPPMRGKGQQLPASNRRI